jgi:hypothetical protein
VLKKEGLVWVINGGKETVLDYIIGASTWESRVSNNEPITGSHPLNCVRIKQMNSITVNLSN